MLFTCTVDREEFIVLEFFEGAYIHKLYLQSMISHAYYASLDSSILTNTLYNTFNDEEKVKYLRKIFIFNKIDSLHFDFTGHILRGMCSNEEIEKSLCYTLDVLFTSR